MKMHKVRAFYVLLAVVLLPAPVLGQTCAGDFTSCGSWSTNGAFPSGTDRCPAIEFFDEWTEPSRGVVACGGSIYYTADGGSSWTLTSFSYQLGWASAGVPAWARVFDFAVDSSTPGKVWGAAYRSRVYLSNDYGVSWTYHSLLPGNGVDAAPLHRIRFASDGELWLVGEHRVFKYNVPSDTFDLVQIDGDTWHPEHFWDFEFPDPGDPQKVWIVGHTSGSWKSVLFATSDAGTSWTNIWETSGHNDYGATLFAIARQGNCATADVRIWVAGQFNMMFSTDDQGSSWQRRIAWDVSQRTFWYRIFSPHADAVYFVGPGGTTYGDHEVTIAFANRDATSVSFQHKGTKTFSDPSLYTSMGVTSVGNDIWIGGEQVLMTSVCNHAGTCCVTTTTTTTTTTVSENLPGCPGEEVWEEMTPTASGNCDARGNCDIPDRMLMMRCLNQYCYPHGTFSSSQMKVRLLRTDGYSDNWAEHGFGLGASHLAGDVLGITVLSDTWRAFAIAADQGACSGSSYVSRVAIYSTRWDGTAWVTAKWNTGYTTVYITRGACTYGQYVYRTLSDHLRIYAVSESEIWITGEKLLRTSPLTSAIIDPGIDSVFYDIIGTGANNILACSKNGNIIRTTDGGTTWTMVFTANDDSKKCHQMASVGTTMWMVGGSGTVVLSTDSGATFVERNSPSAKDLRSVFPRSSSRVYVVGESEVSNRLVWTLFTSGDAGNTWKRMPTTTTLNDGWNQHTFQQIYTGVGFDSNGVGFAVAYGSPGSQIYRSLCTTTTTTAHTPFTSCTDANLQSPHHVWCNLHSCFLEMIDASLPGYSQIGSLSRGTFDFFDRIEACGVNPIDELAYCIIYYGIGTQWSGSGTFIIRLYQSSMQFIAKVSGQSLQASFSSAGNFYVVLTSITTANNGMPDTWDSVDREAGQLHVFANLHLQQGHDWRLNAQDWSSDTPVFTSSAGVGGDLALYIDDSSGIATHYMIGCQGDGTRPNRVHVQTTRGTQQRWELTPDSSIVGNLDSASVFTYSGRVFCDQDDGVGILEIFPDTIDFNALTVSTSYVARPMHYERRRFSSSYARDGLSCPTATGPPSWTTSTTTTTSDYCAALLDPVISSQHELSKVSSSATSCGDLNNDVDCEGSYQTISAVELRDCYWNSGSCQELTLLCSTTTNTFTTSETTTSATTSMTTTVSTITTSTFTTTSQTSLTSSTATSSTATVDCQAPCAMVTYGPTPSSGASVADCSGFGQDISDSAKCQEEATAGGYTFQTLPSSLRNYRPRGCIFRPSWGQMFWNSAPSVTGSTGYHPYCYVGACVCPSTTSTTTITDPCPAPCYPIIQFAATGELDCSNTGTEITDEVLCEHAANSNAGYQWKGSYAMQASNKRPYGCLAYYGYQFWWNTQVPNAGTPQANWYPVCYVDPCFCPPTTTATSATSTSATSTSSATTSRTVTSSTDTSSTATSSTATSITTTSSTATSITTTSSTDTTHTTTMTTSSLTTLSFDCPASPSVDVGSIGAYIQADCGPIGTSVFSWPFMTQDYLVVCAQDCSATSSLQLEGCPSTGMSEASSICGAAQMKGYQPGQAFVLHLDSFRRRAFRRRSLNWYNMNSCSENGYESTSAEPETRKFEIRDCQLTVSSTSTTTTVPLPDCHDVAVASPVVQTKGCFDSISSSFQSPYYLTDSGTSWLATCTSDCTSYATSFRRRYWNLFGCPGQSMSRTSSVCSSANMLGIPVGERFVIDVLNQSEQWSFNSCSLNGWQSESNVESQYGYRLRKCLTTSTTTSFTATSTATMSSTVTQTSTSATVSTTTASNTSLTLTSSTSSTLTATTSITSVTISTTSSLTATSSTSTTVTATTSTSSSVTLTSTLSSTSLSSTTSTTSLTSSSTSVTSISLTSSSTSSTTATASSTSTLSTSTTTITSTTSTSSPTSTTSTTSSSTSVTLTSTTGTSSTSSSTSTTGTSSTSSSTSTTSISSTSSSTSTTSKTSLSTSTTSTTASSTSTTSTTASSTSTTSTTSISTSTTTTSKTSSSTSTTSATSTSSSTSTTSTTSTSTSSLTSTTSTTFTSTSTTTSLSTTMTTTWDRSIFTTTPPEAFFIEGSIGCQDCLAHAVAGGSSEFGQSIEDVVSRRLHPQIRDKLNMTVLVAEEVYFELENASSASEEERLIQTIEQEACPSNILCNVQIYRQTGGRRLSESRLILNVTRSFDLLDAPGGILTAAVLQAVQVVDGGARPDANATKASITGTFKAVSVLGMTEAQAHGVEILFEESDRFEAELDRILKQTECVNVSEAVFKQTEVEFPDFDDATEANTALLSVVLLILIFCCGFCFMILRFRRRKKQKEEEPKTAVVQNPEVVPVELPEELVEVVEEMPDETLDERSEEIVSEGTETESDLTAAIERTDGQHNFIVEDEELTIQCGAFERHGRI
eukprot:TRINITY_DN1864_c0_g1_i2.p1 TRINITY_DN1864_c0_g1~~TRINITY_DN1864_c0_g1_i2.p1  ORF type:complete len:2412 (+),score=190.58 TRINITY_DN1864_c0_g1_i2:68-7303(+)